MQDAINNPVPQTAEFLPLHYDRDDINAMFDDMNDCLTRFETCGDGYQFDLTQVADNLPAGLPDSRLTIALQSFSEADIEQLVLVDVAGLVEHKMLTPKWSTLISLKARAHDGTGTRAIYFPNETDHAVADQTAIPGPFYLRFTGWGRDWSANTLTNNSHWQLTCLGFAYGWQVIIAYTNGIAADQLTTQAKVTLTILNGF